MTSYFLLFNLAAVLCTAFALPAANDLKAKFAEDNEISGSKSKRVSAEFGGYKVAAGLGGGDAGGGLFAGAAVPGASAGAGLYGGAAESGDGADGYADGKPGHNGGFFDRIFNIPISVLHSVNTYVKSKDAGHGAAGASASVSKSNTEKRFAADSDEETSAGASVSASAGSSSTGADRKVHGKPDYDKIFNIPISALKSVNDFLNG